MASIVKINVGGQLFTTKSETLTKYPGFLSILVSTRIGITLDENGYIFIDRNGEVFKHILEFLRSDYLPNFDSLDYLEQLLIEADFYQITPIIDLLNIQITRNKLLLKEIIERSEQGSIAEAKAKNKLDKNYIIELQMKKFPTEPLEWLESEYMKNKDIIKTFFTEQQIEMVCKHGYENRPIAKLCYVDNYLPVTVIQAYCDAKKINDDKWEKFIL